MRVKRRVIGGVRDMDVISVNVFYMGDCGCMKGIWFEVGVLYCWGERGDYIGLVWNLGGGLGGIVRGNRGTVIGLGFDRGVWFYCVCWDEVDNALRKGRGLPKNVNRGDVYKYKNS